MSRRGDPQYSLKIETAHVETLPAVLEDGWRTGLRTGEVQYDPAPASKHFLAPFRFHCLPARTRRPRASRSTEPPPEGLRLPHSPCPFDGKDFAETRQLVHLTRAERAYHLTWNRYPVTPCHFLVVRDACAPSGTLPQQIHGSHELEDIFGVLGMLGPPYRAYFNSNRGADGSRSGSSINHWHFQLFPFPKGFESPLLEAGHEVLLEEDGLLLGRYAEWPAHHVFIDGTLEAVPRLASCLWKKLQALHNLNVAYNVEVTPTGNGQLRAFLFPRCPPPPRSVPGVGTIDSVPGGWELSGDIVITSPDLFEWIVSRPEDGLTLTKERLRETTRPAP